MAGSDAGGIVAMEILVEQEMIAEMRIGLEFFRASENGPPPLRVAQKNSRKPPRELCSHLPKIHPVSRVHREFDCQIVAEIVVVALQGFNQQVVHGKPNRSAPVRISAEQSGARFGRLVFDAVYVPT